ncbi:sigma-70 family RNA polymerase sigma factor [Serratia symbiotica]|uniref:ferric citrate uptake sigma factor FecI n=1 Tax=Serratia symbiotica TaxID=138074 RepID=UPI001D265514|nr:ferric citrate uptake sigma factor FecI [Serratia symbiotica]NIG88475.1 sigma-70 family RNA polymerase sigma factor [Serratia symbiotica]USS96714.1 sigma-70 family RNA polymerase sigma factor [Serratia symbiotica]
MSATQAPVDSFSTLYQSHHRWLRSWIQHKLGSASDAEDLVQDTFMRVLLGGSAPEIREPKSFLCMLARRVMVDFYRRNMLEQRGKETLEYLPEQQIPSPELQHVMLETLQQIDVMLDGLGDKVQCAFLLSQLEGLTYAQVAVQLRVSVSSVKKSMAKATEHCLLFRLRQESGSWPTG